MNTNSKQSGIESIKINKWITFYSELVTDNRPEFNITLSKNGRSAGLGGIPSELVKYSKNVITRILADFFSICFSKCEIPH